jgi:sporulation protein YlmC with PRC-barrel domain
MLWPYVGVQSGSGINHENTPPDELAIHRGSHVNATDGHIGEVEEFVVDPANNGITHVLLREGHLWNRQDVTIPVSQIDHIDDDIVYLTLNKDQIEALPAIAVHRRSR